MELIRYRPALREFALGKVATMVEDTGGQWYRGDQIDALVKEIEELKRERDRLKKAVSDVYSRV